MTRVSVRYILAKGTPVFRCYRCAAEAPGSTVTVDLPGLSGDPQTLGGFLHQAFDRAASPSHMPAGWASYGRLEYRCPKCQKEAGP